LPIVFELIRYFVFLGLTSLLGFYKLIVVFRIDIVDEFTMAMHSGDGSDDGGEKEHFVDLAMSARLV